MILMSPGAGDADVKPVAKAGCAVGGFCSSIPNLAPRS